MELDIAVQMDPLESIDRRGDTTFALLLEAQNRGHELFHYRPEEASIDKGRPIARGWDVTVADVEGEHARLERRRFRDLSEFDVILIRQDPPIDMAYMTAAYALELLPDSVHIVNDPRAIRDAPEKLFVLRFPELIPPTLISRDAERIAEFRREHGAVIFKPLFGNGGADVFRLEAEDVNASALVELFQRRSREPFVVQKFIPEIAEGDKRVLLIDGKPAGAVNRVPQQGELRANLHVGGSAQAADLTERDRMICNAIGPALRDRGLFLAGIDLIGPFLTEINVTSPTGMREIKALSGHDPAVTFWDALEMRIKKGND